MTTVHGLTAPGFERVAELMATGTRRTIGERERVVDLGSGGGAFAAFVDGECVVDIWTGDAAPGRAWSADTRAVIMSSTKGLSALCAHLLYDRAELDVDAPVTRYWPEFASCGKEETTVRQVLSHQSGAIGVPGAARFLSWDGTGWSDTETIAAAIAGGPPAWHPGSRHGYHGLTFGWLVGELVRRIAGVSLGTFFDRDVAQPLRIDCSIGTTGDVLPRVAQVIEWTPRPSGRRPALGAIDPESWAGQSVLAGPDGSMFTDALGVPRFAEFMNTPAVLASEVGAINATATARSVARVYSALATGEELVSRDSVAVFSTEQVCGRDAIMGTASRWALGYTREPPSRIPGLPRQHGPNDEAFGHMGAGGQAGFADPVARVGCAFVRNHLENQALPLMGACLVEALYESVGRSTIA